MCDCYFHPCKVCGKLIPMHLGDSLTARYETEVYCWEHIPEDLGRTVAWHIKDASEYVKKEYPRSHERVQEFIGKKVAVKSLTDNAWTNRRDNYPNLILEMEAEIKEP